MPETTPDEKPEPKMTLIPVPVLTKLPARDVPRFCVVDDVFICQTDEGPFEVALRIPVKTIPLMEDEFPLEQVRILLQSRGLGSDLDRLDNLDIIDARELARKFFQAFGEKEQARLGESFASSPS